MLRRSILAATVALAACDDAAPGECPANAVVNVGHRGTGVNTPDNPFPDGTVNRVVKGVTIHHG